MVDETPKIAVFTGLFPKVSETFIVNLLVGLKKEKYDLNILAYRDPQEKEVNDKVEKYDLRKDVIYLGSPVNKLRRVLKALFLFTIYIWSYPKLIRSFNVPKYGKQSLSLRLFYTQLAVEQSEELDILHAQFLDQGLTAACLKEIGYDFKLVTTIHGSTSVRNNDLLKTLKESDKVIVNSEYNAEYLKREYSLKNDKIKVVPPSIEIDRYKSNKKTSEINLLTVSRLTETKGVVESVKAFKKAKERLSDQKDVKYHICGDGDIREKLEDLKKSLDLEDDLIIHGFVTGQEKIDLYSESDLFILPSHREAFGVVLLEAQASETPIIASDVGGIPEASPGSAELVEPKDVESLSSKIIDLLENPEKREKMKEEGSKHVRKFDNQKRIKEITKIYEEL